MPRSFLGSGWCFPVRPDPEGGGISRCSDEEAVRRSLLLILETAPGERVMRPDFGCAIHDLVFALNDTSTAGRAAQAVREALLRWEPRILLLDVQAAPDAQEPRRLNVRVEYRIRSSNSVFNLVYPFYLE